MNGLSIEKNLIMLLLLKTKENENGGKKKLDDVLKEFCSLVAFRYYSDNEDISKLVYDYSDSCPIKLVEKGSLGDLFGKFDKAFILEIDSSLCKNSITLATDFLYYFPEIFKINTEYGRTVESRKAESKSLKETFDQYISNKKKYDTKINKINEIDEYERYFIESIDKFSDSKIQSKKHFLAELLLNNNKINDIEKSFGNIRELLNLKNQYYQDKKSFFEEKLYKLSKFEVNKLTDQIEYAFLVVGFKIYENERALKKRYRSILFTRFDHYYPPAKISGIWGNELSDCLQENVQYIFHGFNTNEMICVLWDDTFESLKKVVIDRILTEFNKERTLIIESTTIFCPYKNDFDETKDETVDYLIFVKLKRNEKREDMVDKISKEIKKLKNKKDFCRNKCGKGPNKCKKNKDSDITRIYSSQGFFDLTIPVRTRNPCFVSTLSSKIKKLDQVEDTSTIVQISLKEQQKNEKMDRKK